MITKTRIVHPLLRLWRWSVSWLEALQPVAALAARGYVAYAFLLSGLTKLRDWDITLALFTDEYKVPWLPPAWAAFLGTGGELVLPVLLALGLASRFAALGLSVINVVAVISLSDIAPAAFQQHVLWGTLLVAIAVYGPDRYSLDHFVMDWVRQPSGEGIKPAIETNIRVDL
jgi:putative oxidoreductase